MASKIKPFVLHHSSGFISSASSGMSCTGKARYQRQGNVANLFNANGCANPAKKIYLNNVTPPFPIPDTRFFWVCCDQVERMTAPNKGFAMSGSKLAVAIGCAAVVGAFIAWLWLSR